MFCKTFVDDGCSGGDASDAVGIESIISVMKLRGVELIALMVCAILRRALG
jgi:hypothetical protein